MFTINRWLLTLMAITISAPITATSHCNHTVLASNHQVLECYLQEPEVSMPSWKENSKYYDKIHHVTSSIYTFASQTWPKSGMSTRPLLWQHDLEIYRPDTVTTDQALLFVVGGTRYSPPHHLNCSSYMLNFARLAAETHSIVIALKDVPNQYLRFDDQVPRKEDSIIAYSWNRYLDDPYHNRYWPAHLPMTKAIIKAMDTVQQILSQEAQLTINHFMVAGASKRGWATWLAALSDTRINAIVPIVIDILNMRENLDLIYTRYNKQWPPAFHDYVIANIPSRMHTPEFANLIAIEDPLAYLVNDHNNFYQKRLSIPKYIISASSDDFFVPDALTHYLNKLPGETLIRMVPNQSHYIDMAIVEDAVLSYYHHILTQQPRPVLHWRLNSLGELASITTDRPPSSVKLWTAKNLYSGDFRLAAHIIYTAKTLTGQCTKQQCHYVIPDRQLAKGWRSSFVEVSFAKHTDSPLVLTTPAYVIKAK